MTMSHWTEACIPDLSERTAVITGASGGIGFETAKILAAHGAAVVLACRDTGKAQVAEERIREASPDAQLRTMSLDLASLASIREAAAWLHANYRHIDLLINNAGAAYSRFSQTEDGFETTLATNHLGPFAFTGLVLDMLLAVPGSRVVAVSSTGHRRGSIHFDDLDLTRGYSYLRAYDQSKLANLMFTYELNRQLAEAGESAIAVAAHPGLARTGAGRNLPVLMRSMFSPRLRPLTFWLMQSAQVSALSVVRAAVDPDVRGGEYYGPGGLFECTGAPVRAESSAPSHDLDAQRRLWAVSERLTGVTYRIGASAATGGD
jgi:NAD(P)-dependent dehydrogenase (short-subunit alcohol dehydrogenase family)